MPLAVPGRPATVTLVVALVIFAAVHPLGLIDQAEAIVRSERHQPSPLR
jgi:hypothetical protein